MQSSIFGISVKFCLLPSILSTLRKANDYLTISTVSSIAGLTNSSHNSSAFDTLPPPMLLIPTFDPSSTTAFLIISYFTVVTPGIILNKFCSYASSSFSLSTIPPPNSSSAAALLMTKPCTLVAKLLLAITVKSLSSISSVLSIFRH